MTRKEPMIRKLPTFKGYTVDMRIQEFRKVPGTRLPEFLPFLSQKGFALFYEYAKTKKGQNELKRYFANLVLENDT